MSFEPGDVAILKSGGQPMTVVAVVEDEIDCVWLGEEGDLFRERIPAVALEKIEEEDLADEEGEDEDEESEDGEEETAEDDAERRVA